jgi:Fur family ferric uptake transcriptional regulator
MAREQAPDLGIATVYRNIRQLVDVGWLRVVELPGSADRFETAEKCHHHHFHCRRCDRVFEVETCPGGFAAMAPAGYRVEDHDLTLYGLCRSCSSSS